MTAARFCSTCGASVREVPRPGPVQRFSDWFFLDDRHNGDRFECANGHGWTSSSLTYSSHQRVSPMRRLRWLVRTLEGHRTVSPVPATYAMAAGAGLVVGLVTRLVFGWRWWPAAIVAPAAAWCAAAATAFTPDSRARTIESLRDVFDPDGAAERHQLRRRRELDELSFTVYGLSDSSEPPSLGGRGGSSGQLHEVTMTYGDARDSEAPVIDVSTSSRTDPLDYLQHEEGEGLRIDAAGPPHLETSDPTLYEVEIGWTEIDVTLDGAPRAAWVAELRSFWSVIVPDVNGGSVIIRGRNSKLQRPLHLAPVEVQESIL